MIEFLVKPLGAFFTGVTLPALAGGYLLLWNRAEHKEIRNRFFELSQDVARFAELADNLFADWRTKLDQDLDLPEVKTGQSSYAEHLDRISARYSSLDEQCDVILAYRKHFEPVIGSKYDPIFEWARDVRQVANMSISSGRDAAKFLDRQLAPGAINDIMAEKHGQAWQQVTYWGADTYRKLIGSRRLLLDRLRKKLFVWYLRSFTPW